MRDQFYDKTAHRRGNGFRLHIEALARSMPPFYPPCWDCDHEDHPTADDALNCPDYDNVILRQVRLITVG